MIPRTVNLDHAVEPFQVLDAWARSITCERPEKKRIHPPASADAFTWEKEAKKFVAMDCRAQGIEKTARCGSCRLKLLLSQVDDLYMHLLMEGAKKK